MLQNLSSEQLFLLFKSTAVLMLLDTPPKCSVGLDNSEWVVNEGFKGFKLIPLGTHFLHISLKNQDYKFKIRKFIFFSVQRKYIILRWSQKHQDFLSLSQEDHQAYQTGISRLEFDGNLAPYNISQSKTWQISTKFINQQVVNRLESIQMDFSNQYGATDQHAKPVKIGYNYSIIPKSLGFNSIQISQNGYDKSNILAKVLQSFKDNQLNLVGEFQFSFISFLIGQDLDSFEHWKSLFKLFTSCQKDFRSDRQAFWIPVLQAVWTCVVSLPPQIRQQLMSWDSLMRSQLSGLLRIGQDCTGGLKKAVNRLERELAKVGVSLEQQGQQAPVIEQCLQFKY